MYAQLVKIVRGLPRAGQGEYRAEARNILRHEMNPSSPLSVLIACGLLFACVFAAASTTFADILHLKDGGQIDGKIIEQSASQYRVRTIYGTIAVATASVERVEAATSVFDRYDGKLKEAGDSADNQTDLGIWCKDNGLRSEARKHLARAIELEPDHPRAHEALGHARVDGKWIEPAATPPASRPTTRKAEPEDDEQQLISQTQFRWARQIRAVRTNYLNAVDAKLIAEGRKRIAAIRDPLAILPLVQILSEGNLSCRETLVDSLKRFGEDESTLNLAALALLEREDGLREAVVGELVRRRDPRVDSQFRKALSTDNDEVIKRAAAALGALRCEPAVPDLIERLTALRRKTVEVPIPAYFGSMAEEFGPRGTISLGGHVKYRPVIGVGTAGAFVRLETAMQKRDVTVFRTEVQQALVAITGENFGFEADEWRRWYQENKR